MDGTAMGYWPNLIYNTLQGGANIVDWEEKWATRRNRTLSHLDSNGERLSSTARIWAIKLYPQPPLHERHRELGGSDCRRPPWNCSGAKLL
ncbi:hypothetical protein Nepgr_019463 [Nepenthes gracilis]|uniref:Uncharacterized protein n=1 Tax=Nepenthes gracilis TaxID=150966 RepID=A0AAD3XU62_NEPGR|nr:hypothetical protein Nepgr_019463 [Nepenthes gracilis]